MANPQLTNAADFSPLGLTKFPFAPPTSARPVTPSAELPSIARPAIPRKWTTPPTFNHDSGGDWVYKIAIEMSQLAGAFQLTGPTQVQITNASYTAIVSANPQRFGLLVWVDNDAQWFLSPISAPGGGGEGMFNGGFGSNMYFDYRKYGLLVGQKWFAKSQANPVQKLQVVEIVMNS